MHLKMDCRESENLFKVVILFTVSQRHREKIHNTENYYVENPRQNLRDKVKSRLPHYIYKPGDHIIQVLKCLSKVLATRYVQELKTGIDWKTEFIFFPHHIQKHRKTIYLLIEKNSNIDRTREAWQLII